MNRTIADYEAILNKLNPDGKVRAYHIAAALAKRHTRRKIPDIFIEQVKTGSTYIGKPRILDAVAIRPSWANPCITGYEIKVERGDFLKDKKWREYLPYTNEFYFAAPKEIIQESELPAEIGLVTFNPKSKSIRTVKKAAWREIEKATAFDLLYFIIMWRGDKNKNSRTNTDLIEEYLSGKISAHYLGYNFKSKLINELKAAEKKAQECELRLRRFERDSDELKQIREMLLKANVGRNCDSTYAKVKGLIDSRWAGIDQDIKRELGRIVAAADTIKRVIDW